MHGTCVYAHVHVSKCFYVQDKSHSNPICGTNWQSQRRAETRLRRKEQITPHRNSSTEYWSHLMQTVTVHTYTGQECFNTHEARWMSEWLRSKKSCQRQPSHSSNRAGQSTATEWRTSSEQISQALSLESLGGFTEELFTNWIQLPCAARMRNVRPTMWWPTRSKTPDDICCQANGWAV